MTTVTTIGVGFDNSLFDNVENKSQAYIPNWGIYYK